MRKRAWLENCRVHLLHRNQSCQVPPRACKQRLRSNPRPARRAETRRSAVSMCTQTARHGGGTAGCEMRAPWPVTSGKSARARSAALRNLVSPRRCCGARLSGRAGCAALVRQRKDTLLAPRCCGVAARASASMACLEEAGQIDQRFPPKPLPAVVRQPQPAQPSHASPQIAHIRSRMVNCCRFTVDCALHGLLQQRGESA